MDENRKKWNERQKELREALLRPADQARGMELFLVQHAALHDPGLHPAAHWSYADEVLHGLSEAQMRCLPPKFEHTIAWVLWHIARIEDMTMNLLVAGEPQVFTRDGWSERLAVELADTGNAMNAHAVAVFSALVDLPALLSYRAEVGQATQNVIRRLRPEQLGDRVDPERLGRIRAEGGVVEASGWLLDYWGGLSIAQLLLMPPTRHIFIHLNEISRIRQKCR